MYIKQIIKDESNSWIDFLKLSFTIIIAFIFTLLFSLPHSLVLVNTLKNESEAEMSSRQAFAQLESMDFSSQMQIIEPNLNLVLGLLGSLGMLIAIILCNKYINGNTFLSLTTSRQKIDFNRIFYSFSLWASFMVFSILLGYFMMPENYDTNFNLKPFLILTLISFLLFPIQTSAEEYLFRGYMIQNLGLITRNRWFPLIASSVLFGLVHFANPEVPKLGNMIFVYYIGSGLFAGIITLMDEGLELALGWHAANNIALALLFTTDYTAVQTDSILKGIGDAPDQMQFSDVFFPVFIVFPAVIYIFSKKYDWKNWKGKLFGKI